MDTRDKKEDILQKIQSTTDEQLIDEVYELLYPDEEVTDIPLSALLENYRIKLIAH